MGNFRYNARKLRKSMTPAESLLWKHLRNRRFINYKFRRQYPIGHYILDFYCPKARLGIELDGSQHAEDNIREYDETRTIHLESYGIKILRFWNSDVRNRLNSTLFTILRELEA